MIALRIPLVFGCGNVFTPVMLLTIEGKWCQIPLLAPLRAIVRFEAVICPTVTYKRGRGRSKCETRHLSRRNSAVRGTPE